jgi:formylglycine-generating enzyme required for sulfatase activity
MLALIGSSVGLLAGSSGSLAATGGLFPGRTEKYEGTMKLARNYLQRTGYRLPTEAEMEFAIRAGAMTSRFYGESEELLVKYGWYVPNALGYIGSVGRLKPNDFGLFDMHGNVWCWCLDAYREYPRGEPGQVFEDKELELTINPEQERVLCGGCYTDLAKSVYSATRWKTLPNRRADIYGFRVARTITGN